ncbi:hypothetical protein NDU88_010239 [Pleurodeles waltl]|uniref:Uncharacterized protein n=1 Tax=Pleurodeles waltl TaxID=8319 RepID=A0AAV7S0L4_PLEWA|nr:hypothetical protein NDU88_010239 [Pleurodeles waltl]
MLGGNEPCSGTADFWGLDLAASRDLHLGPDLFRDTARGACFSARYMCAGTGHVGGVARMPMQPQLALNPQLKQ